MTLFELALDLKSTGVASAKRDLEGLDRQGKLLSTSLGFLKTAFAGIAVGALFKRAIDEAGQAELAMAALEQAVSNTGGNFGELKSQAEAAAKGIGNLTRFSQTDSIGTLAKMTAITGDASKAMRNLGLAADIAAFKQISLEQAGLLVAKVLTGNTRLLREFGINVKDGSDVMQQLRDKFGGFAEKEGATFQGRLAQLRNAFSDVLEAIGRVIIGGDGAADVMVRIRDKVIELSAYIDANAEKWRAWAKDAMQAATEWYTGFKERAANVEHWFNVIAAAANNAGAAMRVFLTRGGDPAAWKQLIETQKELKRAMAGGADFSDVSSGTVQQLPGVTVGGKAKRDKVFGGGKDKKDKEVNDEKRAQIMLRQLREQAYEDMLRAAQREDDADFYRIEREFNRRRDEIAGLKVSEKTKTDLLLAATAERGAAQQKLDAEIWERIRKQREEQAKKDADAQARILEDEKRRIEQIASDIADVLVSSVTNAFSTLFQGGGLTASLKALGAGILSGLGSIMVMIGKQVIAGSVILKAAVAALLSLNPFVALAAGIALVALGSAIGGAGGGGGGGGGASTGYGARTSASSELTRIKFVDSRTGLPVGDVKPRNSLVFNVFGPNDPQAQRAITQAIANADRRKG